MLPYHNIDPVIFKLGFLEVRWYSLAYLAGFAFMYWMMFYREKKYHLWGVDSNKMSDFLFYGFLSVVIGGRIGHVFFYDTEHFFTDPLVLFRIWEGGMSFHGGWIAGVLFMVWFSRKNNLALLNVSDQVALGSGIYLCLGRLANFINGELWGKPTDLPFGMVFPQAGDDLARHPSQLYEAIGEGLLIFIVLWLIASRKPNRGIISALFLIMYACARFSIEFVREPEEHLGYLALNWFTRGQLLSLPMFFLGIWILYYSAKHPISDYSLAQRATRKANRAEKAKPKANRTKSKAKSSSGHLAKPKSKNAGRKIKKS